ncbi:hypothetical protein DI272_18665 [Streptomyces sp. Act143]|uniref:hypothetical protein n=1 Tax=Streptomyces sp. Act143 TaxID=2200760 RepID=UPI000D6850F2|nr:hypothetical protein [Streptomyces sp. Act143]PWI15959.1 hypothetical protein DI272_18665 [Streptomyces sp. Act143]
MVVRSGSGSAATVDPAACNALSESAAGLLVPSVALQGIAPGGAVGTDRSVDVDVTAPAAGACPANWQVGARLTPVFGETLLAAFVDLVATPSGAWVDSTMSVVLPEAGVYEVTATLHTVIATNPSSGSYNIAIAGRLFNVTNGNAVGGSQYTIQQNADNNPGSFMSDSDMGTFHRFITTAGSTTIRAEVMRLDSSGSPVSTTGLQTANSRLGFKKVSD